MLKPNIVLTTKNVHSVLLFKQIDTMIRQSIEDYLTSPYLFAHDSFREQADDMMGELYDRQIVRTYDVICDHRNNPTHQLRASIVCIKVKYRETHCMINTELNYTISY